MRLFSYVVEHDFGFAPNPFFGFCTLATCKPVIRRVAALGDYVVGTGCARSKRRGYLVYFMRIEEIVSYENYWSAPRFACKRPFLRGNKMRAFGDNIYHRNGRGKWQQENSFHSLPDGSPNPINVEHDTHSDRVLIGGEFAYWGGSGPKIPHRFRDYMGDDICAKRSHRVHFVEGLQADFLSWLHGLNTHGFLGDPLDWR